MGYCCNKSNELSSNWLADNYICIQIISIYNDNYLVELHSSILLYIFFK